jgi:hypothetical protein
MHDPRDSLARSLSDWTMRRKRITEIEGLVDSMVKLLKEQFGALALVPTKLQLRVHPSVPESKWTQHCVQGKASGSTYRLQKKGCRPEWVALRSDDFCLRNTLRIACQRCSLYHLSYYTSQNMATEKTQVGQSATNRRTNSFTCPGTTSEQCR